MPKIISRLVKLAVLFLIILLLVGGIALIYADSIAKTAVEQGGTMALGVQTQVKDINIGFFSGVFKISQLNIANPKGFDKPNFLVLNEAQCDVSLSSLRSDTVKIPLLKLDGLELTIEKNKQGANYNVILDHLKSQIGGSDETASPAEPTKSDESGKKFIVNEIIIRNIVVNVKTKVLGLPVDKQIKLPEIRMTDVGSADGKGAQLGQIFSKVIQQIFASLVSDVGGLLPDSIKGELGKGLGGLQKIGDASKKLIQNAVGNTGKKAKDAARRATKKATNAGEKILGSANDALQELGGSTKKALGSTNKAISDSIDGFFKKKLPTK